MSRVRWWILVVGPPAILAVCFALTQWLRAERRGPPELNHFLIGEAEAAGSSDRHSENEHLAAACEQVADRLAPHLGAECHAIVRPPFVLAGDLDDGQLDAWHRETIAPAMRAMSRELLQTAPSEPITVLLLSGESSYNHYAEKLFGDRNVSIYGYYKPGAADAGDEHRHRRRHLGPRIDARLGRLSISRRSPIGSTKAWLRCTSNAAFARTEHGPTIEGLENWRLPGLQKAIRAGRLGSIESLMASDEFRGPQEGLELCPGALLLSLFGAARLLDDFYRLFRDNHAGDPRGSRALAAVVPDFSWASLDQQFQDWVLTLEYRDTGSTKLAD